MIRARFATFLTVNSAYLLFATSACLANVITFDDINTTSFVSLSNGYQDLNWDNFFAHNGFNLPLSGYAAGLVSAPNDAFNGFGDPASFSSITPFTFVSGYFTGAFNDGLNIVIQGLNGANVLDSTTIVVSSTEPTLETFDWTGLTEVTFNSFGGTPNPNYVGTGRQFVLDNLTINPVPEPGMPVLVGIGLGGLIQLRRKRFRLSRR